LGERFGDAIDGSDRLSRCEDDHGRYGDGADFARWIEARRVRFDQIVRRQERLWIELVAGYGCSEGGGLPTPEEVAVFKKKALHLQEMHRIYRRAARHPRLPVEPDPPEPK
jgi:hypothetical protein